MPPKPSASTPYRGGTSQFRKVRGTFEQGVWFCDCEPKLPAEHFRVKKEGPNQGRWFYTCQKQQDERCGFFLWDEDAEPRMQAAVLANSNSEPGNQSTSARPQQANNPTTPPRQQTRANGSISPPPPYTPIAERQIQNQPDSEPGPSRKRTLPWDRQEAESDTDEDMPWPATVDDRPNRSGNSALTSRKAVKTDVESSPSSQSRGDAAAPPNNSLPTPNTSSHRVRFEDRGDAQQATGPQTPTPVRHHDVLPQSPSRPGEDIGPAVFSFLSSSHVHLTPMVETELRKILETHNHQIRGLAKGRDIAREAVKTRDSKIAELTKRVEDLEADLELYRSRVRSLKEAAGS